MSQETQMKAALTKMVLSIGDFIKTPSHSLRKSSTNGSSIVLITLLGSHGIIPTRIIFSLKKRSSLGKFCTARYIAPTK